MTTWLHYPYSHPWMPTSKRKHSDDDSSEGEYSSSSSSQASQCSPMRTYYHSPKRRRYDLSRNLSRLSLFEHIYPIIEEPQQQQQQQQQHYSGDVSAKSVPLNSQTPITTSWDQGYEEMPASMDADVDITGGPTAIVEEPTEPVKPESPVREVRMRGSSSYEPEKDRIVITDLDSSESESEQDDDSSPFTISSAVLSKFNAANHSHIFKPMPGMSIEDASKAIVLYRPSPWPSSSGSQEPNAISHTGDQSRSSYEDTDAMEIE